MRYVFKPVTKHSPGEFDGLTLAKDSLRLAKRTIERFTGIHYVRLAYDTRANAVYKAYGSRKPVATVNRAIDAHVIMRLAVHRDGAAHPRLRRP